MDREGFKKWLCASDLFEAGCASRTSWAARIEKDFKVDMDIIVKDDKTTLDLIEKIYSSNTLTKRQRANFPNAVRKYYEYKNSRILGTLRQNGRR